MASRAGREERLAGADLDLASVYALHYRSLVRLASLLVDDVGTCEELVQDAFARVWSAPGAVREPERIAAYLRSAVLNAARSHLRRRTRWRRLPPPPPGVVPGADHDALAADDARTVLAALRRLPDRQREVLVLRYYLELSEAEIAAALGVSPGSVKTHAHRGLAALARHLEAR